MQESKQTEKQKGNTNSAVVEKKHARLTTKYGEHKVINFIHTSTHTGVA